MNPGKPVIRLESRPYTILIVFQPPIMLYLER
jgi:hypothetical protein